VWPTIRDFASGANEPALRARDGAIP
jgi:hypothetical protein